jgi:hypothetical protein
MGRHRLSSEAMCYLLVVSGDRSEFSFQKVDPLFKVNVNVIKVLIKESTHDASHHEGNHERQNVLFISGTFQQNDSETNRHAGHPSEDGRSSNERIGVAKGISGWIMLMH